jgi:hypothetical protein
MIRRKTRIVKIVKPKLKPIKTIDIEIAIAKYFGVRQNIIVPNISWGFGMHECDMFIIKRTGIAVEVEIKISKIDLLNDFKKRHQHIDRQHRITEFYYAMPESLYEKCKDLIPEGVGIITCYRYYNTYRKKEQILAHTKRSSLRIKGARKLTHEEQFKIAVLGCMRIFNLKEKIVKLQNGNTKIL